MPHDPALAKRMRHALEAGSGIVENKMFGGYCWMLRGNMLGGNPVTQARLKAEGVEVLSQCLIHLAHTQDLKLKKEVRQKQ